MRTIKFRGKSVKDNTWLFGYLSWYQIEDTNQFINGKLVYIETVGQFTGLYDIEGKEIYEGDIVKDKDGNYLYIIYSDGCFDIRIRIKDKFFSTDTFLKKAVIDSFGLKIIGNIYDNPELFKQ